MNITTNANALAQELRLLAKISATKSTLPILCHVLLRAEDQLRLYATDMEVAMSSTCPATISEIGEMTLPAKGLLDIVEQLSGNINIADGRITAGTFKSRLASLSVADFPRLPEIEGESAVISAAALHALIDRTSYAISDKEQKHVLKGALLSLTAEVIAMVSTDGKRLSIMTASREIGPDASVILPKKTLDVLCDQPPTGDVQFSTGARHMFFNYGRRVIISRMLEGEFPKYQRIIPRTNEHVAQADRMILMASLKRVGLVAEAITLVLRTGTLELSSASAEIGDASETINVQYDGPELKVYINWKYLADFLDHVSEQTVSIALKDAKTPLLLTGGQNFINVIMAQSKA